MRKPTYEAFAAYARTEKSYADTEMLKEWYRRFDHTFEWRHPQSGKRLNWRYYLEIYIDAQRRYEQRHRRPAKTDAAPAAPRSWNICRACPHYRFNTMTGRASCARNAVEPPERVELCEKRGGAR